MYNLKYIYTRCGKRVTAYLPSELALIDCINESISDKPFQYAVSIYDDVQHKTYTLDTATILQERYDLSITTWQQFMDNLKEDLLDADYLNYYLNWFRWIYLFLFYYLHLLFELFQ